MESESRTKVKTKTFYRMACHMCLILIQSDVLTYLTSYPRLPSSSHPFPVHHHQIR